MSVARRFSGLVIGTGEGFILKCLHPAPLTIIPVMIHDGRLRFSKDGSLQQYVVYFVSNNSMILYTGVTSDLKSRVFQHKNKSLPGFTAKYHFDRLVYFEVFHSPAEAIEREKRLKGWTRRKKIELIKSMNPTWRDLSVEL